MKKYVCMAALCTLALLPGTTHAAKSLFDKMSGGVHVSTLGIGPQIIYEINPYATSRLTGSYFATQRKFDINVSAGPLSAVLPTTAKLKMFSLGLILDVHPFQNWFFVSFGAYYNGNRVTLKSTFSGIAYLNQHAYTALPGGATLDGRLQFAKFTPYLGLGTRWKFDWGSFDLSGGVYFQRSPKVKLKVTGIGRAFVKAALKDAETEVMSQVNKRSIIKYYPVISVGVNIKF